MATTVIDPVSHLRVAAIEKPASPERVPKAMRDAKAASAQAGAA
jgi:hypothetical protein